MHVNTQLGKGRMGWIGRLGLTYIHYQTVKRLPAVQETWVRSLGQRDPLEKEMATHSSTLVWKIPWAEEPGRLQSMGSQRVGHDWATSERVWSKGTLLYCSWEYKLVQPLWRTVWRFPKKLKIELPYDPEPHAWAPIWRKLEFKRIHKSQWSLQLYSQ